MKKQLLVLFSMCALFSYGQKIAFINESMILKETPNYESAFKETEGLVRLEEEKDSIKAILDENDMI